MMPRSGSSLRVIGVGNDLRGDDAVGLRVARALASRHRQGVEVVTSGGEPADLIDRWRDRDRVVVIDASVSGSAPGTVQRFRAHEAPLPTDLVPSSSHGLGLAHAVELSRAMGTLPRELLVITVEASVVGCGTELSSAVASAAASVVEELDALVPGPPR